jgi:hypothetical protein
VQLRAETIAIVYELALDQGLSTRRVISSLYELPVVETGTYTSYSRKLERWRAQARNTVNPHTGLPYLPKYDDERDKPRLWPGSSGRSALEPRRAPPMPPMLPEPVREGPYAGRTLTLRVTRTPPPTMAPDPGGGRIVGPDLVIEGRWQDGEDLPPVEPLREVSPDQAPHRVLALIKDLEARYPGAEVKAIVANP